MRTQQIRQLSIFVLVTACSLGLLADNRAIGHDSGCETGCTACSSNSYDCESECRRRPLPNYAYKTLDAVAGGIEKLFGLNKLNCGSACDSDGCDVAIYDDGCDGLTLETLSIPSLPRHIHQSQSGDPTPAYDSHYSPPAPNQLLDDRWQTEPPSRMEMQMGEPRVIEPAAIEPQIQQQRPPANPFSDDDARVTVKRRVRRANHQYREPRSDKKPSPKHRYSRHYPPSNRSLKTLR